MTLRRSHAPSYTPRERALFTEIATTEAVLAKALGFPPKCVGDAGYSPHHETFDTGGETIVSLAEAVAERLAVAEGNGEHSDVSRVRSVAQAWATNIEGWLRKGETDEPQHPDYAAGFADGWSHALNILHTLSDLVAPAGPGTTKRDSSSPE